MNPICAHNSGAELDYLAAQSDLLAFPNGSVVENLRDCDATIGFIDAGEIDARRHGRRRLRVSLLRVAGGPFNLHESYEMNALKGAVEGLAVVFGHQCALGHFHMVAYGYFYTRRGGPDLLLAVVDL